MSKHLFKAGLLISEKHLSFDAMKAYEIGWDIQSSQTEPGVFNSELNAVHTHNLQLAAHHYSKSMLFKGTYPSGSLLLYMFDSRALPCSVDKVVLKNEILVGFPDEEVDLIINSSSTAYTLVVDEEYFNRAFKRYFSVNFMEYVKGHKLLVPFPMLEQLLIVFNEHLVQLSKIDVDVMVERDYNLLENEILEELFGYVYKQEKETKRMKFDVSQIRNYLDANIESNVSIIDVSKALNISERQLHNTFKTNYGMTPKKYLLILRLNAIYNELKVSCAEEVKISDVVYKYGFTHMSHFTKVFKKLFSILPSEVLAQSL